MGKFIKRTGHWSLVFKEQSFGFACMSWSGLCSFEWKSTILGLNELFILGMFMCVSAILEVKINVTKKKLESQGKQLLL